MSRCLVPSYTYIINWTGINTLTSALVKPQKNNVEVHLEKMVSKTNNVIYTDIIRPILCYCSHVWHGRMKIKYIRNRFQDVTRVISSTPRAFQRHIHWTWGNYHYFTFGRTSVICSPSMERAHNFQLIKRLDFSMFNNVTVNYIINLVLQLGSYFH